MKKLLLILLMIIGCLLAAHAQSETITVNANSTELANDLDLKAIATAFGDATSVENFEEKLNDQTLGLSNLDLNGDGKVDYLRCIETESSTNTRFILIQAILAKDVYQDIASISVEKDNSGTITTKVTGNAYIYGTTYVIIPTYIYRPAIYNWFWCDHYRYWRSPYYWGYWPHYYRHHPYCYHDVYHRRMHDYHRDHPVSFDRPRPPMINDRPVTRTDDRSNRRIESTHRPAVDHMQTGTTTRTAITRSVVNNTRVQQPEVKSTTRTATVSNRQDNTNRTATNVRTSISTRTNRTVNSTVNTRSAQSTRRVTTQQPANTSRAVGTTIRTNNTNTRSTNANVSNRSARTSSVRQSGMPVNSSRQSGSGPRQSGSSRR